MIRVASLTAVLASFLGSMIARGEGVADKFSSYPTAPLLKLQGFRRVFRVSGVELSRGINRRCGGASAVLRSLHDKEEAHPHYHQDDVRQSEERQTHHHVVESEMDEAVEGAQGDIGPSEIDLKLGHAP